MAYFNREVGHEIVRAALLENLQGQARVTMCEINWGEFYYMMAKKTSLSEAERRLRHVDLLRIAVEPVTRRLVQEAASLKINYSTAKNQLSFADCFAAALARQSDATLLTGDPEFSVLDSIISIRWLRP